MILAKKYLGRKIKFTSGNFDGLFGEVIDIRSDNTQIYGVSLVVKLSDGRTVYVEKSEHFEVVG